MLALVMACSAITGCSQNNTPQRTESPFTDTPKIEHENTEKTSKTEPPATEPTTTQPTETEPTTTQPPETEPTTTQPPETEPTTTQPPETEPPKTDPPETEPPVVETTTPEPTNNDGNMIDGMRADFKKAMDDYEAFIDEYIEFMKKYSESDGSSLTLLADYLDYMEKYTQAVDSMSKWESDDMNDIERAYYLEVMARCNKKMLESIEE